MITPAPDPVLRMLEALRQSGALRARMEQAWRQAGAKPFENLEVEILQTHYKPMARARLLLEASFERPSKPGRRRSRFLFLQVYASVELARRRAAAANHKHALRCMGPPALLLEEWQAIVWSLPNGPHLRPLKVLLHDKKFKRFLSELGLLPAGAQKKKTRAALIRYIPRRRALLVFRKPKITPHTLYFKAYGPGLDEIPAANLHALESEPGLLFGTPRMLGYSPRRRIIVMQEVPGVALTQIAARPPQLAPNTMMAVGRALASLHNCAITPQLQWSPRGEFHGLNSAMEDVKRALPALAGPIDSILAELGERLRTLRFPTPPTCEVIHGNMFGDQILIDDNPSPNSPHISIVDWDDLSFGDGLYDVGRLIAHLRFLSLSKCRSQMSEVRSQRSAVTGQEAELGGLTSDLAAQASAALLEGYEQARREPADADRLRWHVASALLMRAKIAALRTLIPGWADVIADSVQEVQRILDGATVADHCSGLDTRNHERV